jgi:hypothetical protein
MSLKQKLWSLAVVVLLLLGFMIASVFYTGVTEPSNGGRRLGEWLADLESTNPKTKENATAIVRAIGTNAIPYLVHELTTKHDGELRTKIALRFPQYAFVRRHFPTPPQRLGRAMLGFEALGEVGTPAIPLLKPFMEVPPGYATTALSYLGTNGLPYLFENLGSTNLSLRHNTTAALINMFHRGQAKPTDLKPALPLAINMLQSANQNTRDRAASLLAVMGMEAQEAVPILAQAMAVEKNPSIKEQMGKALAKIDPDNNSTAALAQIRSQLQNPNPNFRADAVMTLVNLPNSISAAVPIFITALNDSDRIVRLLAAEGLGQFRSQPELSLPGLIKALQDPDRIVQMKAAASLRYYGLEASNAIPALKIAAQSTDPGVSGNARSTLQVISPGSVP